MDLAALIRNIPDFPKPGIQFKDVTTLMLVPEAFQKVINDWKDRYASYAPDAIVGIDARGFIFGAALAYAMGLPFVPVRKKGKLPGVTIFEEYALEYDTSILEIHVDALARGQRVIVIDDLLATGGTVAAVKRMLDKLDVEVLEAAFVVELPPLNGRKTLQGIAVHSLIEFDVE